MLEPDNLLMVRADINNTPRLYNVHGNLHSQQFLAEDRISARVHLASDLSHGNASGIQFNVVDYDPSGIWNIAGKLFNLPKAGMWLFNVQVIAQDTGGLTSSEIALQVSPGGLDYESPLGRFGGAGNWVVNASFLAKCEIATQVYGTIYFDGAGATVLFGGAGQPTYMVATYLGS